MEGRAAIKRDFSPVLWFSLVSNTPEILHAHFEATLLEGRADEAWLSTAEQCSVRYRGTSTSSATVCITKTSQLML